MAILEQDDANVKYFIKHHPSKETTVFMHGLGLDHTEFTYLLPYFRNYQVLTFDIRWHGNSTGRFYTTDEKNWQVLFDDIISILKHENIDRFHFVTHGLGAQLAVELVSIGMVTPQSLTVLSTPFYYPPNAAEEGIKYRFEQIKGMTGRELGAWMVPQLLHTKDAEKEELIITAFAKANMDLYMKIFMLHKRAMSLEKLKKVHVPTLLLNGEMDVNYPPALTSLSAQYFPNVRSKIIRHASNMVHVDQPKETATTIIDFLQENRLEESTTDQIGIELPYLSLLRKELEMKNHLHVRVDFLTVFQMKVNGKTIEGKWNQRKAKELIAYLAFYGKTPKEKVYEALWPNSTMRNAQNQFRVALHHLRTLLKDAGFTHFIHTDSQYIWLNEQMDINCDVKEALKNRSHVKTNRLFSDMPVDWVLEIQYELENNKGKE